MSHERPAAQSDPPEISRRSFMRGAIVGTAAVAAGLVVANVVRKEPTEWDEGAFAPPGHPNVAVVRVSSYESDLEGLVQDGLQAVGVDPRGKSVVLKPNLVEFDEGAGINTDPRLIGATVVAMRRMGARSVTVAEGPGHRRDTDYVVSASGLWDVLKDVDAPFVDLNVDAIRAVDLHSYMGLEQLWLPTTILDADMVVSMPKMKTHHWVGVTLSMKNCFGCVPGRVYGWPKNVLHWKGIQPSILDIVGAVNPTAVIVDGIVGMEGDGPIMGTPVKSGHLVFGTDPVATDVVAARVMGVDPERVDYLDEEAGRYLGQSRWDRIRHVGEDPEGTGLSFGLIPEFEYLTYGSTAQRQERDATGG